MTGVDGGPADRGMRRLGMQTDVGMIRPVDEDSILAMDLSLASDSKSRSMRLLVVADGMGGRAKGEDASRIAVDSLSCRVVSGSFGSSSLAGLLEHGIQDANRRILDHTVSHPESEGMGTTVVCAIVAGNDVYVANVGDSRAYAVHRGGIRRITKDHSVVQELVDAGKITEEEARTHPQKNIITRAVGHAGYIDVDTFRLTLDSDESLLLCCDGVMAHLTDDDIHAAVTESEDPQKACQRIIDTANERGGKDNISLIILSEGQDADDPAGQKDAKTVLTTGGKAQRLPS
ncbi:MAG: Stp1/IreP family PP2C-type Ser/Thr phosphatase [Gammaproteobacteria bacterium]|nr:Stp1/IreP family PP2C-type Ser/Thr phosphatase [Gammaproteobacteria bacterium]